ncbi:MAG: Ppx/GppA family phosphatase [Pseudomonadota bacterium]
MLRATTDQGRFKELEPIAVVDIGSNSVRLVVYEGAVRAPFPLYNEKVLCGLGRSQSEDGALDLESIRRSLSTLRRFKALARNAGAKFVHAIATAAVRDAPNGETFITEAEDALGAPVHVLSGDREAELAANGIRMGFVDPDGIVGDLGGGSLELIDLTKSDMSSAITLPLGGLRLLNATRGRVAKAPALIEQQFDKTPWLKKGRNRRLFAIGGTWRALAKLQMEDVDAPLRVMHSYAVGAPAMIAFCDKILKARRPGEVQGWESLSRSRRETLPYGALVLRELIEKTRPSEVVFSIFGIREGLLFSYLSPVEQAKDPLVAFCEDFARLRSRSTKYAHELCRWTDRLFERAGVAETPEERRLRHCACLISDVEWRAQADHRGEQGNYVLAHAPSTGTNHDGRQFLALTIYFRHAGRGETRGEELSGRLRQCIDSNQLERAHLVATSIRVAHMFSIGLPGIIEDINIVVDNGCLELRVPNVHADLDGERPRRRLASLGAILGMETALRIVED